MIGTHEKVMVGLILVSSAVLGISVFVRDLTLTGTVFGVLVAVAGPAALASVVWAYEGWQVVRIRWARHRWGSHLRRWLALRPGEELTEGDLYQWVRDQRNGVTPAMAEQWSASGLPPALASAARPRRFASKYVKNPSGVAIPQALRVVADLQAAGVYDGQDRRVLSDTIGWHFEPGIGGGEYPVLHRWVKCTSQEIRSHVSAAQPERFLTGRGPYGPCLYDLERTV